MYHDVVAFTFDRFENHLRAFYVNQPLIYHGTFSYRGDEAMLTANDGVEARVASFVTENFHYSCLHFNELQ